MALKIDVHQVVHALDALSDALKKVYVRISIAEMLDLCEESAASQTGHLWTERKAMY